MNSRGWWAVDSFPTRGALHAVETVIANADLAGERFQSDARVRAVLLPVRPVAEGEVPGAALTGAPAEAAEVLFLDPADGAGALSLLVMLGDRGRTVLVALPPEADATGLVAGAGRVTVAAGTGPPVVYGLFRTAGPRTPSLSRPTGVPKLGEDADVLERRADWFQTREGRGD
jgi:hypothetical protein